MSSEVWSMLQEAHAHLRANGSLLERNYEDLRSKDSLLERKDSLLERKDSLLERKDRELSELLPLVAQLKFQQYELLRYKNIVNCEGRLNLWHPKLAYRM